MIKLLLLSSLFYCNYTLAQTAKLKQPNIVFILVDDLGWADISLRGAPIDTPAIDSLFSEGLTLDRFYTTPICSPTRAALEVTTCALSFAPI